VHCGKFLKIIYTNFSMINSLIGFIILSLISPFLLIIGIMIMVYSGLPILFKQRRIGQDNIEFFIYKFRTMKVNTPDVASHLISDIKYNYTKIGPFLRKYSLDELPQLINIVKGNMNFIGPRPALYNQKNLINLRKSLGVDKLKPGITGWAQVNGRDSLTSKEKVKNDVYYLKHKSFLLDFKIIILTLLNVIKSKDAK
tara:strand:+ start:264 stop:857 length:594 start_codon:yes stop_codon:yes gene_type:complete